MHIDGQRIHARWLAPDTDRLAVVLLHEGLGSVAGWERSGFAQALAGHACRGVFAFDRCGYGESQPRRDPWRLDFLKEEAVTWLPAVLDAAGIDRAVLYGHSDGGTIGLDFAARHPDRVAAVVAEAPHVVVEPLTMAGIRAAREAYAAPAGRLRLSLQKTQGTCADELFEAWSRIWLDPLFAGCDIRESLDALRVPCLVIQGDQDPYGTDVHLREVVARSRGPVTTWLLDGVGHAPHREDEGLAERVARFIDEVGDE
jgi:pimeloyl-ACP methyl ester carboxylesterase